MEYLYHIRVILIIKSLIIGNGIDFPTLSMHDVLPADLISPPRTQHTIVHRQPGGLTPPSTATLFFLVCQVKASSLVLIGERPISVRSFRRPIQA